MADELRDYWTDTHVDRCDVLLDAAQDHVRKQRPSRAIAIWQQLISEGGRDGDFAHVEYADYLFALFKNDEARTELAAVMAEGRIFSTPWLNAAEMLEERGDLAEALVWYTLATDYLTAEDVHGPKGPLWAKRLVAGRRRVKWTMGLPLDDTDLLGQMGDVEAEDKELALLTFLVEPAVVEGRMQFLPRGEFDVAGRGWSGRISPELEDAYYQDRERELRGHEGQRLVVVPWTFESWVAFMNATWGARSHEEQRYIVRRYGEGEGIEWPPQRNQPCWCGSGTKYKRCCGAT
ncbi:MAG: hypothetical protein QOH50_627 [Kribbellaceae bacterium]|nr:hypothetical protein [Kribbellaceae bacterium]